MSKLYCWIRSDLGNERTKRGSEKMNGQINYGSRKDSKRLVEIAVYYPHINLKDDTTEPTVSIWFKDKRVK